MDKFIKVRRSVFSTVLRTLFCKIAESLCVALVDDDVGRLGFFLFFFLHFAFWLLLHCFFVFLRRSVWFPVLMRVRMMWAVSPFYCKTEPLVGLLRKVSNQIIAQVPRAAESDRNIQSSNVIFLSVFLFFLFFSFFLSFFSFL